MLKIYFKTNPGSEEQLRQELNHYEFVEEILVTTTGICVNATKISGNDIEYFSHVYDIEYIISV